MKVITENEVVIAKRIADFLSTLSVDGFSRKEILVGMDEAMKEFMGDSCFCRLDELSPRSRERVADLLGIVSGIRRRDTGNGDSVKELGMVNQQMIDDPVLLGW